MFQVSCSSGFPPCPSQVIYFFRSLARLRGDQSKVYFSGVEIKHNVKHINLGCRITSCLDTLAGIYWFLDKSGPLGINCTTKIHQPPSSHNGHIALVNHRSKQLAFVQGDLKRKRKNGTNTDSNIYRHLTMSNIREVVKRKVDFAKSPKQRSDRWEGRGDKGSIILSYFAPRRSCAVNAVTLQRCQSSQFSVSCWTKHTKSCAIDIGII